jgi:hypothetical protein
VTDPTPQQGAKPKRRHSWMKRLPIPDAQPMGRGGGRDDRKRWHILEHTKPVCERVLAGDIVWHAPYAAVKDKRICDHCHGRFSWRPAPQDFEYVDLGYTTPCKVWSRGLMSEGYGSRGNPNERKNKLTHREAYEAVHGTIPEGFVIHHLCGQKTCLEVDHMDAMSRGDHLRHHAIWRSSSRSQKGVKRG